MSLFMFQWGFVFIYVVARNREAALKKIRKPGSIPRLEYPHWDFHHNPTYEEEAADMITHYGWD